MPPTYTHERKLGAPQRSIAGVDEVGRGALAGPVVAAAVILKIADIPDGLDDSKKLSPQQRERAFAQLSQCAEIGIGAASCREIDQTGIVAATFTAMRRALTSLPVRPDAALIDGLYIPDHLPCLAYPLVRGDQKSLSIAAASIVAKVSRDRLMQRAARRHPHYGWSHNVGYGTKEHLAALRKLGATKLHRFSFAPLKVINR